MSVQEEYLSAIAEAIRARDGTAGPIRAKDFPARIRAIGGSPSGSCGIDILEDSDPDKSVYSARVILADVSGVDCKAKFEALEGFG